MPNMMRGMWHETQRLASLSRRRWVCAAACALSFNWLWQPVHMRSGSSLNLSDVRLDDSSCPCGSWQVPQEACPFQKYCERSNASNIKVVWLSRPSLKKAARVNSPRGTEAFFRKNVSVLE